MFVIVLFTSGRGGWIFDVGVSFEIEASRLKISFANIVLANFLSNLVLFICLTY